MIKQPARVEYCSSGRKFNITMNKAAVPAQTHLKMFIELFQIIRQNLSIFLNLGIPFPRVRMNKGDNFNPETRQK